MIDPLNPREPIGFGWLAIAVVAVAIVVIFMLPARGHQAPSGWAYPYDCCSDRDCAPLDAQLVTETQAGWTVAGSAGGGFVARGSERFSPDGAFHICRVPGVAGVRCLFVPPRGV